MRISLRLCASAMLMGLMACSQPSPKPLRADSPLVGLMRMEYKDQVRLSWDENEARPLTTYIWYPAESGSQMIEIGIPPSRPVFIGGHAARDANFEQSGGVYPLIVMSHGTGGAAMQMMWLAARLADHGYIVAAVDHHGNTAAEDKFDARGFRLPWERASDISAVINHLLVDPTFGPKIDEQRIGAAGFSLGGYTVTALAGGITNFTLLKAFCTSDQRDTTCDDQSEYPEASTELEKLRATDPRVNQSLAEHGSSFRDARIRAVLALAPALGQAFTESSLADIDIPFLFVAGSADTIAPVRTNAARLADKIPGAKLQEIDGANHYAFLNTCNKRGQKYVPVCKDPQGVERAHIHELTVQAALDFFDAKLSGQN